VAINTAFWFFLAVGRGVAIFISQKVSSRTLLCINMGVSLLSMCIPAIFNESLTALWIGVCMYGLGLSSAFATAYALVEHYVGISASAASAFNAGAGLGSMIMPLIAGIVIDEVGVHSLLYILIMGNFLMCTVFVLLVWQGERQQRVERLTSIEMMKWKAVQREEEEEGAGDQDATWASDRAPA